jgi:DNA-binding NarL/FixJ family response regulator
VIKVYIITANRSYRDMLEGALLATGRIHVIGGAEHPLRAITELRSLGPDVTLLDLPTREGPLWVRQIGMAAPSTRVLALGLQNVEDDIMAWADAGVAGYLGREASFQDLAGAIDDAARGEAPCHPRTAAILLHRVGAGPEGMSASWQCGRHLTDRELEILQAIDEGLSNHQIARRLFIALSTVKNHVHNILEKVGVHHRAEAVREVRRAGLFISPERALERAE